MQDLETWEIAVRRLLINHGSLKCLRRYRRTLLTPLQNRLIKILSSKIERFPNYFDREDQRYSETASLVLMSDWDRRVDFVTCMDRDARREFGVMHAKRPVLNCRYWRLCDHDAWRRVMDLQCRFLRGFDQPGHWMLLTFSFTGFLPMVPGYSKCSKFPITHIDLTTYWDANRFAIEQMVQSGMIQGAILDEELHLESLFPVPIVTPHSHLLLLADKPLGKAEIAQIESWITGFRGSVMDVEAEADNPDWNQYLIERGLYKMGLRKTKPRKPPIKMEIDPRLKVELPVSLNLQRLHTQEDLSRVLSYSRSVKTPAMTRFRSSWRRWSSGTARSAI